MEKSRSEYVIKNVFVSFVMQIIKNVLTFLGRTVFVYILGVEYTGVNSLFTDVLTVLSFAELGIGNAMVFSLYKPLAEGNQKKIKSLMHLYAKAYRIIGIVISVLGICVVPFLRYIVGDVTYVKENIVLLYLLFLLNSVLSYFFVYKKSLIIADQKNYIVDIYQQVFYAIQIILQSVFLLLTKQFILYLLITVLSTFFNNFFVARRANKMYPYLLDKDIKPLEKAELNEIVKNIKALVIYKLGGIIIDGTDSIFISVLDNIVTVGLYSNYKMIISVFRTIGNQIMNSVVASIGNLNASSNNEKKERVFYECIYLCGWFYGFATAGLCIFLTPLVELWLGGAYTIGVDAVIPACIYFYISNMHYPCYTYRTTAGLFIYGKYVPIIAAIINVILDIILGMRWGLTGILWASVISKMLTYEVIDPFLVFKRVFHKSVKSYFGIYICIALLVCFSAFIGYRIAYLIPLKGIIGFIFRVILFSLIYHIIFLGVTIKTKTARSIFDRIGRIIFKKSSKKI